MKWESKNLFTAEDAEDGQRYEKTTSKGAQFHQRLHFRRLFAIIKAWIRARKTVSCWVLGGNDLLDHPENKQLTSLVTTQKSDSKTTAKRQQSDIKVTAIY